MPSGSLPCTTRYSTGSYRACSSSSAPHAFLEAFAFPEKSHPLSANIGDDGFGFFRAADRVVVDLALEASTLGKGAFGLLPISIRICRDLQPEIAPTDVSRA